MDLIVKVTEGVDSIPSLDSLLSHLVYLEQRCCGYCGLSIASVIFRSVATGLPRRFIAQRAPSTTSLYPPGFQPSALQFAHPHRSRSHYLP